LFTFLTEIFSYLETFFDKNIFKLIIWVLIYPIFILLVTIAFLFTFMFVIPVFLSTLIAGPFNNLLAKEVEEYLTGKKVEIYSEPLLTISSKYIKRKLIKLWYYLKRFIVLIIKTTFISTIPIINILSPKLWFSFTTWLVILEYSESPFINHNQNIHEQRKLLTKKRDLSIGFAIGIIILLSIPYISFLIMPVAVAGATSMWINEFSNF